MSIHSEDRPEWVILDLATVAVRGITVGLYPTNPTAEVEYLLGDSGATVHLAEDQEQVDKVFAIDRRPAAPAHDRLRRAAGTRGTTTTTGSSRGTTSSTSGASTGPPTRRGRAADGRGRRADDVMTLVYTSGTTGPPKGAMLTNANAAFCIEQIVTPPTGSRRQGARPERLDRHLPAAVPRRRAHLLDLAPRACGTVLNFAESIETVTTNLREVQPTLFFAVPGSGRSSTPACSSGPTTPPG